MLKIAAETKQVGKFGAVGIINTLLDFTIYNLLISLVGLAAIVANIGSTTVAMIFSFIVNKKFVFGSANRQVLAQAALFLAVTMFGLYGLQNGVIYLLHEVWSGPLELGFSTVKLLGLENVFGREFVFNNGAKAIATLFSLTWNYLLYRNLVFKR